MGDIYTITNPNPAMKIFNQDFFGGQMMNKYGDIPTAPKGLNFMSSAMFGDNAAIGLDINTYSVGVFHRNQFYGKYAYKVGLSENWFLGMGLGVSMDINSVRYSDLDWKDPNSAIVDDEKFVGSSAMVGFLISDGKTFVSLYGEHTVLGLTDGRNIDTDMAMLMDLEVAYRFSLGDDLSLRAGIETEFVDFSAFSDVSTLPLTLDLSLRIYDVVDIGFEGNHNYLQGRLFFNARWFSVFYEYTADYGYQMIDHPTNNVGFVVWFKKLNPNQNMLRTKIGGGQ